MPVKKKRITLIGFLAIVLLTIGFVARDLPIILEYARKLSIQLRDTSIVTFKGHSEVIRAVAFSPDGSLVASGSHGTDPLLLWESKSGRLFRSLKNEVSIVRSLAFSRDGRKIFVGGSGKFQQWDFITETVQRTVNLADKLDGIGSVAISRRNQSVLIGSKLILEKNPVYGDQYFGITSVMDLTKGGSLKRLPGLWSGVPVVTFSPDGQWALSAGGRNQYGRIGKAFKPLVLWDVATWKPVGNIDVTNLTVYAAAFSPDSRLIATADSNNKVKFWSIKRKISIKSLKGQTGGVRALDFSRDGSLLVSGSLDGSVNIWSVASGKRLKTFVGHLKPVYTVAFSPDGKTVVSGSDDKTVKVWKVGAISNSP